FAVFLFARFSPNAPPRTVIYTLSLHDALPIYAKFTISIPSKDSELSLFMEEKLSCNGMSVSAYIRELIRKDMDNQENTDLEQIYAYVMKRIIEEGYVVNEQDATKVSNLIDEADKDIIMDLFYAVIQRKGGF